MADKYWNEGQDSATNYLHWIEEELTDLHHTIKELSNIYTGVQVFSSLHILNNISPSHDVTYVDGLYKALPTTTRALSYSTVDPIQMYSWLIKERNNEYV